MLTTHTRWNQQGNRSFVDVLCLDLEGVLIPEIWQAVAARTYAWTRQLKDQGEPYDICSSPACQVYAGAGAERALTDHSTKLPEMAEPETHEHREMNPLEQLL